MENNGLKKKILNNLIPIIFGGAGIVLFVAAVIIISGRNTPQVKYQDVTEQKLKDCDTKKQKYIVDGGTDLFPPGTEVEVDLNYYACNKGQRDDIVLIKTPGREQPLIKIIKMIPGDTYKVVQAKDEKYRVIVNGDEIENPAGEQYAFSERKMRMIKLYESNFKDGIKEDVYFVFGESTAGGFDSTRFGPIMPERMVGKVLTKLGEATKVVATSEKSKQEKKDEEKKDEAPLATPDEAKPGLAKATADAPAAKPKLATPVKPAAAKPIKGKPAAPKN